MKKMLCLVLALCLLLLCGCGSKPVQNAVPEKTVRIGALTGPTSMGMVKLMENSNYKFTLSSDPAAFITALARGEMDIAAMPANLAAAMYNNGNGSVEILAINTLGVLYIVERGDTVHSLADLRGRTIYATGAGSTPEYTLRYLLGENGLSVGKNVAVQWCADTTEALSYIVNDPDAVAMLPQPFVTSAQLQVNDLRIAVDLNAEWSALDNGSAMVTGVLVANREFVENNSAFIESFMKEYEASVDFVLKNPEEASDLIGEHEILMAPIALKALPYCNITCITGRDMEKAMEGYLQLLYDMNPNSIGGKLPESDFYYGA